jgi:uncharacterized membrane protein YgcG
MSIDPEELLGSIDTLIQFIDDNTAALTAKGLAPATIKASLTGIRTDLFGKFTTRNNARTALTNAQTLFETAGNTNYKTFSDAIDIVAGAMGKLTAEGKQVQNMRKNVTGSNKQGGGSSSSSSSSSGGGSSSSSSSGGGGGSSSSSS